MPEVIADITMSLDGYVTGPGADEQHGLGDAPELRTWVTEQDAVDTEILEGATAQSGAVVMGRRLFDIVDGPGGWNEEMGYGADQAGTPPFLVVTHARRPTFGSNESSGEHAKFFVETRPGAWRMSELPYHTPILRLMDGR